MADTTNFEGSINDFLNEYLFIDSEKIYTNGALLIPVFRVYQALNHYYREPVHAHWILKGNGMGVCSNCNHLDNIDPLATHCRYCGAKMDAEI